MDKRLKELKNKVQEELNNIKDNKILLDLKTKYLGRKGELTKILKEVKNLSKEEKPKIGKLANEVKEELIKIFEKTEKILKGNGSDNISFDASMPGQEKEVGNIHPSTTIQYEIELIKFKESERPTLELLTLGNLKDYPRKGQMVSIHFIMMRMNG